MYNIINSRSNLKKIIIIGGGISGLSAGIYAQNAGFDSSIFEKNSIVGGECTGWDRRGYHIDGSIHWLTGSKEGTKLNLLWKEIGALSDVKVYQPEYFDCTIFDGNKIFLFRDRTMLIEHLVAVSPNDEQEIVNLLSYCDVYSDFEPPYEKPLDLMKLSEKMIFFKSMSKMGPVHNIFSKMTVKEYLETRFENLGIQLALQSLLPEHYKATDLFFMLGSFVSGNAGRPKGGSRAFSYRVAQKYKKLGGDILLSSDVDEIIIERGIAKGIKLTDGSLHYADYIISTCDAHISFDKLLRGKYNDKRFDIRYKDLNTYPLLSCVYLSFGVDLDLSNYPIVVTMKTDPFVFEDKELCNLTFKHYCDEPTFSPEGQSIITVYFQAQYDWWQNKRMNVDDYKSEKVLLSNRVIDKIERQYSELKGKISVLDVATPITYERYCGAFKGSYMSFGDTPNAKHLNHNGIVRGVKRLFLAGQWFMPPGGLPSAALTGKWAVDRILNNENKKRWIFF